MKLFLLLIDKIKSVNPSEIGGHIGDMVNFENSELLKIFFNLKSNNLEFREKNFI